MLQQETKGARLSLVILTFISLLNYIDRYSPSSLKEDIIADLNLSDFQSSIPSTFFLFIYMISGLSFSHLADIGYSRPRLLLIAILLWTIPVTLTYFSQSFIFYFFCRGLVGVGEGAYSVITPALISDMFPPLKRNKALAFFYLSIPIGAALGFITGGILAQFLNWRAAFLILGILGIPLAALTFFIKDPGQGNFESKSERNISLKKSFILLWKNRTYGIILVGQIFVTFALGALSEWGPTFFSRRFSSLSEAVASLIPGISVVIGGFGGTIFGSWISDFIRLKYKKIKNPYFFSSGTSLFPAFIFIIIGLYSHNIFINSFAIILGMFFIWMQNGPMGAVLANCTEPFLRGKAFGLSIFFQHLLGDGISPFLVGFISDKIGHQHLDIALLIVPLSIFLAGIIWTTASFLFEDEGLNEKKTEEFQELQKEEILEEEENEIVELEDNEIVELEDNDF